MSTSPLQWRSACEACRQAKVKCSGGTCCIYCRNHNRSCHYSHAGKVGKPRGSQNGNRRLASSKETSLHGSGINKGKDKGNGIGDADMDQFGIFSESGTQEHEHRNHADQNSLGGCSDVLLMSLLEDDIFSIPLLMSSNSKETAPSTTNERQSRTSPVPFSSPSSVSGELVGVRCKCEEEMIANFSALYKGDYQHPKRNPFVQQLQFISEVLCSIRRTLCCGLCSRDVVLMISPLHLVSRHIRDNLKGGTFETVHVGPYSLSQDECAEVNRMLIRRLASQIQKTLNQLGQMIQADTDNEDYDYMKLLIGRLEAGMSSLLVNQETGS